MDEAARVRLTAFAELLKSWNKAFNLVSRQDINRLQTRHIDDALRLLPQLTRPGRLLDIGSGAGLPGIVLAIAEPSRPVVVLDRSERKCRFLTQAVAELDLQNVEVVCEDAASYAPPERFAYVVSRAVASADTVWKWAEPVLEKQGRMLHMTGNAEITVRGGTCERG